MVPGYQVRNAACSGVQVLWQISNKTYRRNSETFPSCKRLGWGFPYVTCTSVNSGWVEVEMEEDISNGCKIRAARSPFLYPMHSKIIRILGN